MRCYSYTEWCLYLFYAIMQTYKQKRPSIIAISTIDIHLNVIELSNLKIAGNPSACTIHGSICP